MEGIIEAVLESSDERKVPASLSLFLKSGKFPAVLYIGKGPEYRPFCDLRSVPEALLLYINFDSFHHLNQVVVTRGVCVSITGSCWKTTSSFLLQFSQSPPLLR